MDLGKLYDNRIMELEREVHNLKVAHFKTATTISTMANNQTLSFSLMWDELSGQIFSTQRAIITMVASNSTDMISACYLSGLTPSTLDDRYIFIKRLDSSAGQVRFGVTVFSQNYSDYETLSGGGSVNLSYTVQLVGSSKFTASVSYKSITGGTA